MKVYSRKDKYGSYQLSYENKLMHAVVTGAVGESLAKQFAKDFTELVNTIDVPFWGYVGDMTALQAYTTEAEVYVLATHNLAMKSGSVIDTYCIGTAVSKAQLIRIRKQSGIESDLEDHLYGSIDECAKAALFIINKLEKKRRIISDEDYAV
ncbi:hypothetical protein [Aliiglaciecola sp. LCG003]|uniref:hypothetical protein n=1 Tax=Aliiglaciecola sp. LCG003 TaxID=3053655 RepID=UPI0025733987|nr:hypothetical protein [Aliiglaciecola sp. LCG003]WJG08890.1 hypothetical protein QR722_16360 [Aliiglaciecola sp. LCG003]